MFDIFIEQLQKFIKFLADKNIITTGIAFIIAFQVNKLFLAFIEDIATPVANRVMSEKIGEVTTKVVGITFKTGDFIFSLFHFLIILLCIYYIMVLTEETPGFLSNIYSKITSIF